MLNFLDLLLFVLFQQFFVFIIIALLYFNSSNEKCTELVSSEYLISFLDKVALERVKTETFAMFDV
jgi:hypothetical protein